MKQWVTDVLLYPTLVLAVLSIFADIYGIASTSKLKVVIMYEKGQQGRFSHDYVISDLILWLCLINLLYSMAMIPQYGFNWKHFDTTCFLIAFAVQFLELFMSLWHILIASYLLYLLIIADPRNSNNNINNITSSAMIDRHNSSITSYNSANNGNRFICLYLRNSITFYACCLIILVLSFIGSLLPLTWHNHNHYNIIYNYRDKYNPECWLTKEFELISYGVVTISIFFDIFVLLVALYKHYQTRSFTNAYFELIRRLSVWVIVFVIVRIFPVIDRIVTQFESPQDIPLSIVAIHNYSRGAIGIANGITWYLTKKMKTNKNAMIRGNSKINKNNRNNKRKITQKITFKTKQPFDSLLDDDSAGTGLPTAWRSHQTTNTSIQSGSQPVLSVRTATP